MPVSPIRSKLRASYCSPAENLWKEYVKDHTCEYDTMTDDPAGMTRANPYVGPSTGTTYEINRVANAAQVKYKWQDVSCRTLGGVEAFLEAYDASVHHGGFVVTDYDVNEAVRLQWEVNFHKNNALVEHAHAVGIAYDPAIDFDACIKRGVIAGIARFWYQGP